MDDRQLGAVGAFVSSGVYLLGLVFSSFGFHAPLVALMAMTAAGFAYLSYLLVFYRVAYRLQVALSILSNVIGLAGGVLLLLRFFR